MWEDEATWRLQSRCKICPDAIGEAADIVVGDTWPDATPVGEDAGSGLDHRAHHGGDGAARGSGGGRRDHGVRATRGAPAR